MIPFQTHNLLEHDSVSHGFFGREGGVSRGVYNSLNTGQGSRDNPDHVFENRRRVAASLGTSEKNLQSLHQIHSPNVLIIEQASTERPKADGLVTCTPGLAISALSADCAPVLFMDSDAGVIGACHAGWRGALAGVTNATINAMETLGASRSTIQAVIGPCIHQDAYQVGAEFRDSFVSARPSHDQYFKVGALRADGSGSFQFDLPGYLLGRLRDQGLSRIGSLESCTYSAPDRYFSYRYNTHQGVKDYGRNISAIMLR